MSVFWAKAHNRRTYSVHRTEEAARQAAHDLGRLMNGTPIGYCFAVMPKMGAYAFISYCAEPKYDH